MGYSPNKTGLDGKGTTDVFLINKVFRAKCTKPAYCYYGYVDKPGSVYWPSYMLSHELDNPSPQIVVDHGIVVPVDCYFRGITGIVRTTKGTGNLEVIAHRLKAEDGYAEPSEEILSDAHPLSNHVKPNPINSRCLVELEAGDVIMLYVRRVLKAGFLGWSRHVHGSLSLIFERKD
tara:strand:- start:2239 stop:2766 length:528 start_codon:yes stop_codon:yes gene_type:complete